MACVNSMLSRCSVWRTSVTLPVMVDLQPVPLLSELDALNERQLRAFASTLLAQIARRDEVIAQKDQDIL